MSPLRYAAAWIVVACLATDRAAPAAEIDTASVVSRLQGQAASLRPMFRSPLVHAFLDQTASLPHVEPRTVLHDSARTRYWSLEEAADLPDSVRSRLVTRTLDEGFYYETRYGTPLAYARPLEIVAENRVSALAGRRIADFGYGTIGHLRLLAQLGAEAHGIEVDLLLRTLYAPDTGVVSLGGKPAGRLVLHHGRWPAEPALTAEVGGGYDLFLSKNTLKNGYIHPAEKVDPRRLVHLGVDDSTYVRALSRTVRRGGLVLIYNLCPAPAPPGKTDIPWADGRCPFSRGLWEASGFEVLAFDQDDSPAARTMARALGWNAGDQPMDLENDLFAVYSLFRRR